MLEILDLSLHVAKVYALPLMVTFALGVLPAMIVNQFLIGWRADVVYDDQFPFGYMWNMALLVYIQAPLASIFATDYLGKAVFQERPSIRQVIVDMKSLWGRIGWCQLIVRAVGPICLLYLLARGGGEAEVALLVLIHGLTLLAIFLRIFRPFINEIIVLERNPLFRKGANTQTIGKRSRRLHSPASGDLFARWMGAVFFAVLLWMAFYSLFLFAGGVMLNNWRQGPWAIEVCYPISLWMVVFFFTVVRFLSYLDTRIRQEGWEVELKLKAEANKLAAKVGKVA